MTGARKGLEAPAQGAEGAANVARTEADGVVTLTLSRPPANSLDNATIRSLKGHLESLGGATGGARCVILTGSGSRFFSAGGDVKELEEMTAEEGIARVGTFDGVVGALERLEVPAVCAVNGDAVGGGTELCLFADYRIAVSRARFGLPEVNHGLLPVARSIQQAVRLLGLREARRLLFEGRLIGAEEAARIGLVDAVVADVEELRREAARWAAEMARKPRTLLGPIKRTLMLTGRLSGEELLRMALDDFRTYFQDPEARGKMRELIERWRRSREERRR